MISFLAILAVFYYSCIGIILGVTTLGERANRTSLFDIRTSMFNKLVLFLLLINYHSIPTGRVLAKLTYDTEPKYWFYDSAYESAARRLTVVGLLSYMIYMNWRLSLLFLIGCLLIGWLFLCF